MTKEQLIEIAQQSTKEDITKTDAKRIVDGLIEGISQSLEQGEEVRLVGFGTFKTKVRSERQGRNPQTGETITIPAKTAPVFTPGKSLKARVNK